MSSWRLFSCPTPRTDNPLNDGIIRMLIDPGPVEGLIGNVLRKTMNSSSHGPTVIIQRIERE